MVTQTSACSYLSSSFLCAVAQCLNWSESWSLPLISSSLFLCTELSRSSLSQVAGLTLRSELFKVLTLGWILREEAFKRCFSALRIGFWFQSLAFRLQLAPQVLRYGKSAWRSLKPLDLPWCRRVWFAVCEDLTAGNCKMCRFLL